MTEQQRIGIEQIRGRLAVGIRDLVLGLLNSPTSFENMLPLRKEDLSAIESLTNSQKDSLTRIAATALDYGMHYFLKGLDDEPDGLSIAFEGHKLIEDGLFHLSTDEAQSVEQLSRFDKQGRPK